MSSKPFYNKKKSLSPKYYAIQFSMVFTGLYCEILN